MTEGILLSFESSKEDKPSRVAQKDPRKTPTDNPMVSSVEIGRGSLVVEDSVEEVKLEGELAGTVELVESVEAVADVDESSEDGR